MERKKAHHEESSAKICLDYDVHVNHHGLVLLVISERYNKYWDEYDTYRIVKLVAANGYVKENTDEAIAFVIIDKNDKPDIQVNNTF